MNSLCRDDSMQRKRPAVTTCCALRFSGRRSVSGVVMCLNQELDSYLQCHTWRGRAAGDRTHKMSESRFLSLTLWNKYLRDLCSECRPAWPLYYLLVHIGHILTRNNAEGLNLYFGLLQHSPVWSGEERALVVPLRTLPHSFEEQPFLIINRHTKRWAPKQ